MKLFKKIRKGFTLIELVVVIAVIAILSAVAVVSYISITNKAKQSSDEQAVRQMNTALKASSILGINDITDLYNVLAEEGMDAKNYKPLSKDTYFFWDQDANQIVYAKYKDGQYIGIYPSEYKDKTKGEHHWFSLSKEIKSVDVAAQSSGQYTGDNAIETAEELYTVLSDSSKYQAKEIELKANSDIDLMGADISFKGVESFDGKNSTLSNVSQLQNETFDKSQSEDSNSGLFGQIIGGEVTIENVKIKNTVVGSKDTKFCGILGGAVRSAKVTVRNVTIENSTVYSLQKGGILFGYVSKGSSNTADETYVEGTPASQIIIEDSVKVTGCKVATLLGEGGKLIGALQDDTKLTNSIPADKFDVKLERITGDNQVVKEITSSSARPEMIKVGDAEAAAISSGVLVYNKSDAKNYKKVGKVYDLTQQVAYRFRFFNENAMFTLVSGNKAEYNGVWYNNTVGSGKDVDLTGTGLSLSETITVAKSEGTVPVVL